MVVKSQIKLIKSLQQKKYRSKNRMFVVEGIKMVQELLNSNFTVFKIFTTDLSNFKTRADIVEVVSNSELRQMSGLKNPNQALGAFYIPESKTVDFDDWILVLDDVRDPGNLGTIIRLCDWFGIKNLVCSKNTVDCYNPKVLQASMGSIARVNVVYNDLEHFLDNTGKPLYGAFMSGSSVYKEQLPKGGILVMGNEANGISKNVEKLISSKIAIPQFGDSTTESLNVATATAILLNEIRRK
ncbi:TrmH family RNA methyltransferase [Maribacter algicola]|uniref:TrmH family RNA methyltransferase n=1 Tax=Meishania litoralis TaxID=3434685 RepID=A0ACC7LM52_9FLAO